MCYVPRSRLNSRNVTTSFKVHEELDTNKLCSYRACEFTNFTVFQQNGYNKSNNVFHLRGNVAPPSILRANYRPQGVVRGRHTTTPSWQENISRSRHGTVSLPPVLNTKGKRAIHFLTLAMVGRQSSSAQQPIPLTISNILSSISLPLGTSTDKGKPKNLKALINTCAALCIVWKLFYQ